MADAFAKGYAGMIVGAFVIGIAYAISMMRMDSKIVDSIVELISHYGTIVGANLMFYAKTIINFFVT